MSDIVNHSTGEVLDSPSQKSPFQSALESAGNITDEQLVANTKQSVAETGGAYSGFGFLKFSGKNELGKFFIGSGGSEREFNPVSFLFVVVPKLAVEGWICWGVQGHIHDKKQWLVATRDNDFVPFESLPDYFGGQIPPQGQGWKVFKGLTMLYSGDSLEMDSDRRPLVYTSNAIGAINAMNKLSGLIVQKIQAGEPCCPLVRLGQTPFTSKGNTNSKPVFEVYGWLTYEQVAQVDKNELDLYEMVNENTAPQSPQADNPPPQQQPQQQLQPQAKQPMKRSPAKKAPAKAPEPKPAEKQEVSRTDLFDGDGNHIGFNIAYNDGTSSVEMAANLPQQPEEQGELPTEQEQSKDTSAGSSLPPHMQRS